MEDNKPNLTRQTGTPVGDNQNVQTAGFNRANVNARRVVSKKKWPTLIER